MGDSVPARPDGPELRIVSPPLVQGTFSRRISWGAIFAGTVVAFVLNMMLAILGVGIGAATVNAQGAWSPRVGFGAATWIAVSCMLSFFCAGWTGGRLAGIPRAVESTLHGFLVWGLSVVLAAFLLTSAVRTTFFKGANVLGEVSGFTRFQAAGAAAPGGVFGAALFGFSVMLVGAGLAAFGGFLSTPKNTILTALPAWERRGSGSRR